MGNCLLLLSVLVRPRCDTSVLARRSVVVYVRPESRSVCRLCSGSCMRHCQRVGMRTDTTQACATQPAKRRKCCAAGDLVEEVKLIDDFTNKKTGRTSNCYRISYRSNERSLTDDEINGLQVWQKLLQ